ncbi:MAG TPA: DUF3999 family protein [Thermoanaerobaculia bacterium]|nr:DUF3999 family protein [Thermoanaerobaculia bacterium]
MRLAALMLFATSVFAGVERTVTPGGAGANRLDADVALVAGAAEGLRDLRLYDPQQREVGYLLIPPASREPQWVDGRILPIASTKTTSGFEVDLHGNATVDRLRLQGIAAPFLKRVRVEGSGDRARWTLLADSTLFDLPEERLQMLAVAFEPGAFRYLRVTWDDRSSARVTSVGGASARLHGPAAPAEPLRATLAFRKRASEPGKSRYRIHLPGPRLPVAAIEVRVANGNVFRTAIITEPRLGNGEVLPAPLGSGTLRRAERAGAVAEEMAIDVERPLGRELDLAIDDGNNAPLAVTGIVARFIPQPWIYFETPAAAPLVARYGNERLAAQSTTSKQPASISTFRTSPQQAGATLRATSPPPPPPPTPSPRCRERPSIAARSAWRDRSPPPRPAWPSCSSTPTSRRGAASSPTSAS